MKEGPKIRPEWVPNAYKSGGTQSQNMEGNVKAQPSMPLHTGKKAGIKRSINHLRKKP